MPEQNEHAIAAEDRVPLKEKVAYGAGQVAGAFQGSLTEQLMQPIFVLSLGMPPAWIGILSAIYRIWDGITDVLMGWISDNTRTRWGRRRPYIFLGALLGGLWLPIVWLVNPEWSLTAMVAWLIFTQLVMFTFFTIWNIPYQSLMLEMTPDTHERTNVAVARQYLAAAVWGVMPWAWYVAEQPWFGATESRPSILQGALWVSVGAAVLTIIFGSLPALFCRERYYKTLKKDHRVSLWKNIKATCENRPFRNLLLVSILFLLGMNAKIGLALYLRVSYACQGDKQLAAKLSGYEGTITTIIALLGIPLFQWLARRYGKRQAMTWIMAVVFLSSISTWFSYRPDMPYLSIMSGILLAPTSSAIWVLIPSMSGDIVDHDELETGERREGAFAAVYSWVFKFAVSAGMALSGALVAWSGFDEKIGAVQSAETIFWMRLLLATFPAACVIGAMVISTRYPLDTKAILATRRSLELRRGKL